MLKLFKMIDTGGTVGFSRMFWWNLLQSILQGTPFGFLIAIVWLLFRPLRDPSEPLNLMLMLILWAGLTISIILYFFVSKRSYQVTSGDAYRLAAEGRIQIAERLRQFSMGFFKEKEQGDVVNLLLQDYTNMETMISHMVPQTVCAIALPLWMATMLFLVDWRMAIAAIAVIPLAVPVVFLTRRVIAYFGKKRMSAINEASSSMLEYIDGIRWIKAFNMGGSKFDRLRQSLLRLKKDSIRLEAGSGPSLMLGGFILHTGFTVIMLAGLYYILGGALGMDTYIIFLIAGIRIYEPLTTATLLLADINYLHLSAQRLGEINAKSGMNQPSEDKQPKEYGIKFVDVSFAYGTTPVLKKVSFTIPQHGVTALIGPSGAGKSTILRLIARFWDVQEGGIFIGNTDIRDLKNETLMSCVSIVFQEVYLFHDTIMNNIRIGRQDASEEDVIRAAKTAHCLDFISRLPNGYDTMVGEGGSTLSGGEKQRISIARALLKDAPIVLLDEATASLDPENEFYIQQAINAMVRDKTVVVIAHRLHTVVEARKILVLSEGEITAQGAHERLLEKGGLYSSLWKQQQITKGWKLGGKSRDVQDNPAILHGK